MGFGSVGLTVIANAMIDIIGIPVVVTWIGLTTGPYQSVVSLWRTHVDQFHIVIV